MYDTNIVDSMQSVSWGSAVLLATAVCQIYCYMQNSIIAKNIRNILPFGCKVNIQQKYTKNQRGEYMAFLTYMSIKIEINVLKASFIWKVDSIVKKYSYAI